MTTPVRIGMLGCGFIGEFHALGLRYVREAVLTVLGFPEAVRQILFGSIIVIVAAAYTRVTAEG